MRLRSTWTACTALLQDALLSLTAKPARTFAMLLGIVLATMCASGGAILADTQEIQVDRQFDLQRSGVVVLRATTPRPTGFDERQLSALRNMPVVSGAGEFSIWRSSVKARRPYQSSKTAGPLLVVDAGGLAVTDSTVTMGADVSALPDDRRLVWVGVNAADELGVVAGTATSLVIGGRTFTVAGVVTGGRGYEYVDAAFMISRAAASGLGSGENVRVVIGVRPGAARAVADYALAAVDPTGQSELTDVTPPDGAILVGRVANDLRAIGLALALFVGLVGVSSVANVLGISVTQRKRELGLRAALGWSPRRIWALIITESALAGALAGVLGCLLGLAACWVWCEVRNWELVVDPWLPLTVVAAGTLASVFGGLLPARRAARTSPLSAMRS